MPMSVLSTNKHCTQKGGVVQGAAVAGLAEAVEDMRASSATIDENYECASASEVYRVYYI